MKLVFELDQRVRILGYFPPLYGVVTMLPTRWKPMVYEVKTPTGVCVAHATNLRAVRRKR